MAEPKIGSLSERKARVLMESDTLRYNLQLQGQDPESVDTLRQARTDSPGISPAERELLRLVKLLTHEPHLKDRIATTIGLLCGWQYSHHAIRAISEFEGVEPSSGK